MIRRRIIGMGDRIVVLGAFRQRMQLDRGTFDTPAFGRGTVMIDPQFTAFRTMVKSKHMRFLPLPNPRRDPLSTNALSINTPSINRDYFYGFLFIKIDSLRFF
jgi:hypothetical protein